MVHPQPERFQFKATTQVGLGDPLQILADNCVLEPVSLNYLQQMFQEFTPEITTYMVPTSPESIDDTRNFIESAFAQRQAGTDLIMVILSHGDKEFLGVCGLHVRGEGARQPEFGLWIKKSAHGNGYGREAIHAFKRWADEHLEVDAYIYPVDKRNVPSRKIPESLRGVVIREVIAPTMNGGTLDEVVYRIPAGVSLKSEALESC